MKIRYVTITGADNNTPLEELRQLSNEFPFVEWAILFSQAKVGVPRFPDLSWVYQLLDSAEGMNLSAHLCGKWVDDAFKFGRVTFFEGQRTEPFQRTQFNCNRGRLQQAMESEVFKQAVWKLARFKQVIIGGNYTGVESFWLGGEVAAPLFDASGGRGVKTKIWPPLFEEEGATIFCGYAGGLGPDNIVEEIRRIEEVVGDHEIWIDMETRVRSGDELDLGKVRTVLETVAGLDVHD